MTMWSSKSGLTFPDGQSIFKHSKKANNNRDSDVTVKINAVCSDTAEVCEFYT